MNVRLDLIKRVKDDHALLRDVELDDEATVCKGPLVRPSGSVAGDVGGEIGVIAARYDL